MPANLEKEKSAVATGLEKVSFHSNPKERQCQRTLKLLYSYTHLTHCKVMLKILQARLQQYMNWGLQDVLDSEADEPEIKLPLSTGSLKSKEIPEKIYFCFIDYAKAFDCVDHKLWKILK